MFMHLKPAVIMLVIWTVLTGLFYPALVTGIAQALFPEQANGSLVQNSQGQAIGSELIGQPFSSSKYFWGRPSVTALFPYNAAASGGSNLGPTNPALADAVKARIQMLKTADPGNRALVPVDLIAASGSGLDPHISPAAAEYQANRVAKARGIDSKTMQKLIARHTQGRQWGIFGEPRINVLLLNRALDALH